MLLNSREMELETEIPIWFNGRIKWISNLSCRSKCCDVIKAILLSTDSNVNENYILYESWRGVERALKSRCRLLKLWKSWGGESENIILTLRLKKEETNFIIKKKNKLKYQINKFNNNQILNYFNLSQEIIYLNNQINNQQKLIFNLTNKIKNENKENYFIENDFKQILSDVNQTFIISRKLTFLYDQFDQQINQINQQIENKQIILDELELDLALQENIHLDNIDQHLQSFTFNSPPTITPIKTLTGFYFIFYLGFLIYLKIVLNRPTAIVEPSLSKSKTSPLSLKKLYLKDTQLTKTKIKFIPFSISQLSNNNDESDTGISSIHSNDEQLITLV